MFNNFNLKDEEVLKILGDYDNLIVSKSNIDFRFDEDLCQELKLMIYKVLTKNRKKFNKF